MSEDRTQTNTDDPAQLNRSHPTLRYRDAEGEHAVIVTSRALVGSSESVAIRIVDPTVSRLHAEVEPTSLGLAIRDLDSRNGVRVGAMRVGQAVVPHGTHLSLGATEIVVDYSESRGRSVDLWQWTTFGPLFGQSLAMREMFALVARIAASDATVLIHGETGTGKDLVAHAIHEASPRRDGPFVIVDCGALPEHLLEAELFGHAKGAFTGAAAPRIGALEAGAGGTVFLDEIGEMPLAMQPKLLRVLEARTVRRIGENHHRPVDVRFVFASHRDLQQLVANNAFREDLYFRLAVLRIDIPPLRSRREDVLPLARRMLASYGPGGASIPRAAAQAFERHGWPGNVRELRNVIDRASVLGWKEAIRLLGHGSDKDERTPSATSALMRSSKEPVKEELLTAPFTIFRERWADRGDRLYLDRLLAKHNGNVAAAATEASVDPSYVYRIMRRLGRTR